MDINEYLPQIIGLIVAIIFFIRGLKKLDTPIKKSEEQAEMNLNLLRDIQTGQKENNELMKEIINNQKIQNDLLKKISETPAEDEKKKLLERWKQATEIINNFEE